MYNKYINEYIYIYTYIYIFLLHIECLFSCALFVHVREEKKYKKCII